MVAVPEEAGQVIGGGAGQRVLKVDDAEAARRCQEQVAAVVVAMNQASGLAGGVVDQCFECVGSGPRKRFVDQGAQEPFDKNAEFVTEPGLPIRGDIGSFDALERGEGVDGKRNGRVLERAAVDILEVPVAQVAEQEESLRTLYGDDRRNRQAMAGKQLLYGHKRLVALQPGRRFHDDQALILPSGAGQPHPVEAAVARFDGQRFDGADGGVHIGFDPLGEGGVHGRMVSSPPCLPLILHKALLRRAARFAAR